VVSFPRLIPPGGEGTIRVRIKTIGYGGHTLRKTFHVRTNDPKRPNVKIQVFGRVEPFVFIRPGVVHLIGSAGGDITVPVRIIPEKKYAFSITGVHLLRGRYVEYRLKKIRAAGRPGYLLTVKNRRKTKGRYSDVISLKTTSPIRPEIKITVYGNILGKKRDREKTSARETGTASEKKQGR